MNEREIDRSLIDAAREGLGPSAEERARLRRAVAATIAGGAVAGTAVSGAAASATAAKAVAAWKIIAVAALATTLVGGAAITVISSRTPEPPRASDPAPQAAPAVDDGIVLDLTPPDAPPTAEPEAPQIAPEPVPVDPRPRPRASAPPPAAPDALLAETALLRDAHRALRAHDATRALALLDDHAARFPQGTLREERLATRVLALCEAGRTDAARTETARFLAAHPRSMHAARVRAACGAAPIQ
ncbi:hypothetical protein [Sandaracinus amylolyticus]|uniref:hypothetical protein n=1 Tax=Sandaracinus amylolyticus TaxID=927083 RepID=UPI001F3880A7|nr:hypothetical protein [Sandaracinus amylolyticus]UJR81716.1 Hypothetical protein I5071_37760 [Sandaracinus amylolyticus]